MQSDHDFEPNPTPNGEHKVLGGSVMCVLDLLTLSYW